MIIDSIPSGYTIYDMIDTPRIRCEIRLELPRDQFDDVERKIIAVSQQ